MDDFNLHNLTLIFEFKVVISIFNVASRSHLITSGYCVITSYYNKLKPIKHQKLSVTFRKENHEDNYNIEALMFSFRYCALLNKIAIVLQFKKNLFGIVIF